MTFNIFTKQCLDINADLLEFIHFSQIANNEIIYNPIDYSGFQLANTDFTKSNEIAKSFLNRSLSMRHFEKLGGGGFRENSAIFFGYNNDALKYIDDCKRIQKNDEIPDLSETKTKRIVLESTKKKSQLEVEVFIKKYLDDDLVNEYNQNKKIAFDNKNFPELCGIYESLWGGLFFEEFENKNTLSNVFEMLNVRLQSLMHFANQNKSTLMYSTCFTIIRHCLVIPLRQLAVFKSKIDLDLKTYLALYPEQLQVSNNEVDLNMPDFEIKENTKKYCWLSELGIIDTLLSRLGVENLKSVNENQLAQILVSITHSTGSEEDKKKAGASYRKIINDIKHKDIPSSPKNKDSKPNDPFNTTNIQEINNLKGKFGIK